MAPISEETTKEIQFNQTLPLIGDNFSGDGNGYHDSISWNSPNYRDTQYIEREASFDTYLRDLGLFVSPNYSRKNKFETGLKVINHSPIYFDTLLKYLNSSGYYRNGLLEELSLWSERLCNSGRVVYEIIGWYDNKSSQFYAFQLRHLENRYCKLKSDYILYSAPFEESNGYSATKEVKIPKTKCIIIEFPKVLGGYNGFIKKEQEVLKLGSQFNISADIGSMTRNSKKWEKDFNKTMNDWGVFNSELETTEFHKEFNAFKFAKTAVLCTHEVISGLNQLIMFLNAKFNEDASVNFDIKEYEIDYFKSMETKWLKGELSFKEATEFLSL